MSGHVFHSAGIPLTPVYRSEGKPHKIQYVNKGKKGLEDCGGGAGHSPLYQNSKISAALIVPNGALVYLVGVP